jgi:CheY-like chemotaxis protein
MNTKKPTIQCENFEAPENLVQFMKEAIGEILRISPYESYLEAYIRKELADYRMTISVNYSDGKFKSSVQGSDLKKVVTQATAEIFTQVRRWWKTRFGSPVDDKTDWAGNIAKSDFGQVLQKTWGTLTHTKRHEPARALRPLRVLVVDDDIESVTPLELCLEKLGCETFVVNNGFEAIHEIVSDNRTYDVIILDWNMPEMNGGQALINAQRVISFSPSSVNHWENDKLPVITYSSRGRDEVSIPECNDFTHLDHWEKPSSYLHLLNQAAETFAKL